MYQKSPYQKGLFFSRFSRSAKPHIRQRIGVKWKFQVVRRARFSRKLAPDNYSQAINPHFRNSVLTEMHALNLFLCSSGSSIKYVHNQQRGQNSIKSYGHTELHRKIYQRGVSKIRKKLRMNLWMTSYNMGG